MLYEQCILGAMAPSHKAETVNQILTNYKKLFNVSHDHFHCGPHATGNQLAKEVASLSTCQEGQNRQEMERSVPCSLPTMVKQSWWQRN